jgi:hypothetical protein
MEFRRVREGPILGRLERSKLADSELQLCSCDLEGPLLASWTSYTVARIVENFDE